MKKLIYILVFVVAYAAYQQFLVPELPTSSAQPRSSQTSNAQPSNSQTSTRSEQWRSGQQVKGSGRVVRILADDNDGSRHQRFILELSSGQTLLVAHNIDLAPRISSIRTGDTVTFHGQFEANTKGGVVHWTHHDPQGRHVAGWLEHRGQRYQ
jgi:hypothetical protein